MMMMKRPPAPAHAWLRARHAQRGLTLVELLVAVALSTVIALAAIAALVVSRRGFTSVDAASQLRDNARFASSMIQRISGQSGFLDWRFATVPRISSTDLDNPDPNVTGFNNALITDNTAPLDPTKTANNNRTGACSTDAAMGCSDILVVRYQPQSVPGANRVDSTMIDCSGAAVGFPPGTAPPVNRDDRGISIFHVAMYKGEPTLMCTSGTQTIVAGVATYTTPWAAPVPVIQGVENFQVLYGTDNAGVGVAPSANPDSVPDQYLRADQLVAGNATDTNNNWRRVRSIRIGMVLRGPRGSQQEFASQTFYPFGLAKEASGGTPGFAMSTTDGATSPDKGTRYTPTTDGRLRHVATFTVYMHNDQGLCFGPTCAIQGP